MFYLATITSKVKKVKISVFKKNRVRPILHQGCENSRLDRINQLIAIYNKCGITWFLTTFYLGKSCFIVFCTCLHPQQQQEKREIEFQNKLKNK